MALVVAWRRFDPSRGVAFGTYASAVIKGRIRHYLKKWRPLNGHSGEGAGPLDLVLARTVRTADQAEAHNPNLLGGDVNGGAATLRQTVFRPVARWNPYRTPVEGVYLCSASTPPGGGVHGMCGAAAAEVALRERFS